MKTLTAVSFAAAVTLAAPAAAEPDGMPGWEYARVVRAEPVYRPVRVSEPRRVCEEVPVTERTVYHRHADPGAVLIGGLIGGVIGHQFGRGHRDGHLATAAGAMIGASHAARHSDQGRTVERTVYETSCHTRHATRYEEHPAGYEVTYRYRGRLYRTHTPEHPGRYLRVRVEVTPVTRYAFEDSDYGDH